MIVFHLIKHLFSSIQSHTLKQVLHVLLVGCYDDSSAKEIDTTDVYLRKGACITRLITCGTATCNLFIHTINRTDLADAENLGFTDVSTLSSNEHRYVIIDCQ